MSEVFTPTPAWQEQIFKVLKEGGIQQVSYVPDAGHAHVIRRALYPREMVFSLKTAFALRSSLRRFKKLDV